MDIPDYRISEVLPYLTQENVAFVANALQTLGVHDLLDTIHVNEKELTANGILKPVEARKLLKFWQHFNISSGKTLPFRKKDIVTHDNLECFSYDYLPALTKS